MADFVIKQNDTRPKLVVALRDDVDGEDVAVDLTLATSVKFLMRPAAGGAAKVSKAAAITDAVNGVVTYTWEAANTDTVDAFEAEIEVTWNDGGIETFPAEGYISVDITDDIG